MKALVNIAITILFVSFISCTPKADDSKNAAKDQNAQKFKNTKIEDDTEFAVVAADGGLLEVKLGELAQTNGSSEKVKSFGKMMVDDHSKANSELKSLAREKNITLPQELSSKNQDTFNGLVRKTGKDFDDAYTEYMVKDHKEDIDEFKKEADKGKDNDLKSWAAGKIPVLEHHLEMAKQAESAVDKME